MAVEVYIAEEVQSQRAKLAFFRPLVGPMPDFTHFLIPPFSPRTPSPWEAKKVLGGGHLCREWH